MFLIAEEGFIKLYWLLDKIEVEMRIRKATKKEVNKFIKSQRTFTAQGLEYKKAQKALSDVLLALPIKDYKDVTKNLILSVLHEKSLGQLMHFKPLKGNFKIMQLTVPRDIPLIVLRYVIAHELGHALQKRNWRKSDEMDLELDADKKAKEWGFNKTKKINRWMIRNAR